MDVITAPYPAHELLLRDIAYFFHEQAKYGRLEEDIDWAMFELPYWTYLNSQGSALEQRGCLAIILAGAAAHAGNICMAFGSELETCRACVQSVRYEDPVTERLRVTAAALLDVAALDISERPSKLVEEFDREWPYDAVVVHYFAERAGTR